MHRVFDAPHMTELNDEPHAPEEHPTHRRFWDCPNCRVSVAMPSDLSLTDAQEFAALCRRDRVGAMRFAENQFSLGLRESKALVLHVTSKCGVCHRCNRPLASRESVCACRSLNLDW